MMARATSDSFDEDPDAPDLYAEDVIPDEPDVLPCPYCGEEVSELAEFCPHCKSYISREDAPPPRKPLWFVVTAVVMLVIFVAGSFVTYLLR